MLSRRKLEFPGSRWQWKDFGDYDAECLPFCRHYTTARQLKRSAEYGCILCNEILKAPNFGVLEPAGGSFHNCFEKDPRGFSSFIIRALNGSEAGHNGQNYQFILANDETECFQLPTEMDDSTLRYPSLHSGSEHCFDQIRKWYSICVESHERCVRGRLRLPTRLLDVGTQDLSGKIMLRDSKSLVEKHEDTRYLALSYCWGGDV